MKYWKRIYSSCKSCFITNDNTNYIPEESEVEITKKEYTALFNRLWEELREREEVL